jgi:hypothetical protein
VLPLRGAREQHGREVHHEHEHHEHAGETEHEQSGADSGDQVRLEAHRVQLQAAALEVARVDGSANRVHRSRHGLR